MHVRLDLLGVPSRQFASGDGVKPIRNDLAEVPVEHLLGLRRGDSFVHSPRICHAALSNSDLVLVEVLAVDAADHADRAGQGGLGDYRGPTFAQAEGCQAVIGRFYSWATPGSLARSSVMFGPSSWVRSGPRGWCLQEYGEGGLRAPGGRIRAHPDPTGQCTQQHDGEITAPTVGKSGPASDTRQHELPASARLSPLRRPGRSVRKVLSKRRDRPRGKALSSTWCQHPLRSEARRAFGSFQRSGEDELVPLDLHATVSSWLYRPSRRAIANGSPISRWIMRRSGRAPNSGS